MHISRARATSSTAPFSIPGVPVAGVLVGALLVGIGLVGCGNLASTREFAAALADPPANRSWLLTLRDGRIAGWTTPVPLDAIPAAARRTAEEFVQPGGKLVFTGRVSRGETKGYRLVKEYPIAGSDNTTRRSVLVAADGRVLERSHEIPPASSPAAALAAVTSLGAGRLTRVLVLQGTSSSHDRYRFELVDTEGRRHLLVCSAEGKVLARGRVLRAEMESW